MITTNELATKELDTVLLHNGYAVYLYGVTEQADGGYCVELGYADAGGGRYFVEVGASEVCHEIWDYDDEDC